MRNQHLWIISGFELGKSIDTGQEQACWGAIKRLLKRRLVQAPQAPFKAPIHSKCCIGGFRETGLTLVIVLRCDWPLCDLRFKSYEHFKIKMFLSVPAGPWWIFQPKSSEQSTENAPVDISPPALSQTLCTAQYFGFGFQFSPAHFPPSCRSGASIQHLQQLQCLNLNGSYPEWHSCESLGCQLFLYKNCNVWTQMAFTQSGMDVNL